MHKDNEPSFETKFDKDSIWSNIRSFIWETIKVIVVSLAIIIPVRFYVIQPFYVKGASMEPAYFDHEYLIIDELSYNFRDPFRGEVVVFHPPNNSRQFYIKRVIGLPNERIRITGGNIYLYSDTYPDGKQLAEDYLDPGTRTSGEIDVRLTMDEYFVLGDHRNASLDSRVFGAVLRDGIVGRTWLRGWPLNRMTVFNAPINYGEIIES